MGTLALMLVLLVIYKLADRWAANKQLDFYDGDAGGGTFIAAVLVQGAALFLALIAATLFVGGIIHAYFG